MKFTKKKSKNFLKSKILKNVFMNRGENQMSGLKNKMYLTNLQQWKIVNFEEIMFHIFKIYFEKNQLSFKAIPNNFLSTSLYSALIINSIDMFLIHRVFLMIVLRFLNYILWFKEQEKLKTCNWVICDILIVKQCLYHKTD